MNKTLDAFLNRNIDKVLEWQRVIKDMLDHPHLYGYADNILRSIYEYTESAGDITDSQVEAIENIRNKPSNNRRRYGRKKRRY